MNEISEITKQLNLAPHPEGGFYKETYRSEGSIDTNNLGKAYNGTRNFATAIYFLLTSASFSAFHRIKQDETWHFYKGKPLKLYTISPAGILSEILIGNNITQGEVPQYTVPGGHWFASEVAAANDYSLVGCTVAPGFDFNDFELAKRSEFASLFPQHASIINKLTR